MEILNDVSDKIECLNGYLKIWLSGGKVPLELESVIKEADEFTEYVKASKRISEVGMVQYLFENSKSKQPKCGNQSAKGEEVTVTITKENHIGNNPNTPPF